MIIALRNGHFSNIKVNGRGLIIRYRYRWSDLSTSL